MIRGIVYTLVLLAITLLSSCGSNRITPWDSNRLDKVQFVFEDQDLDKFEVQGEIFLRDAPLPTVVTHYMIYWSNSDSQSGKGSLLAQVPANAMESLYIVPENTKLKGSYFLLYLHSKQTETYSGKSLAIKDNFPDFKITRKSETKTIKKLVINTVLFDFDSSDIKPEAIKELEKSLEGIDNKDQLHLIIFGHADERGSNEYNMALGEQRGYKVKRFFISRGFLVDKISVRSLGEEQPASTGEGEESWRLNRRVESKSVKK